MALQSNKILLEQAGINDGECTDPNVRKQALKEVTPSLRSQIFASELAVMVFEYGLFVSFVAGMHSGMMKKS